MKSRIRRKIVKQACLEFGVDESMAWGWLAACQWNPGSARSLRRLLVRCLDDLMDYGFGRFSR